MLQYDSLTCFVITPIGEDESELRKEIDGVIDACIFPSLLKCGFDKCNIYIPHRMNTSGMISHQIMEKILSCDLVIANLTELSPNVMYELAVRHFTGKPTIQICNANTKLPFDTQDIRTLFYNNDTQGGLKLIEQLESRIKNDLSQHIQINPITQIKDYIDTIRNVRIKETDEAVLRNANAFNQLGINNIYTKPEERPVRKEISSAKEIYFLAYAGDNFVERYLNEFASAYENGASIFFLLGKKGSDFFREVDLMESTPFIDNKTPLLDAKVDTTFRKISRIKNMAQNNRGKIEIRIFNTEFRNALTICKDFDGNTLAWLTIMFGYKRAGDCMMIEFRDGKGLEDCKQYFDKIWSLHNKDILCD